MGIESFYGIWLLRNFDERKLAPKYPPQNVSSLFIDCNGIFHKAASETYYYTTNIKMKEEYALKQDELYKKFKSLKERDQKLFLQELQVIHIRKIQEELTNLTKRLKPRDNLVIVPDGVSNAAKINQQKGRRFKKEQSEKNLFDSNCITPGTDFMFAVDKGINEWIISQKRFFANGLKIIYSSHMSEGEGEHKIFDLIRNGEIKPPTGPSVIYGMDADLIILSLLCPLKDLLLSRENLFKFLSIDALREQLVSKLKPSGQTDEQIIRDFSIMSGFIGNDFIPALASRKDPHSTLEHFTNIYTKLKKPLTDNRIYKKEIKEGNGYIRQVRIPIFAEMKELEEVKNNEFWMNKVDEMSRYQFPTLISYLISNMKLYYDRRSRQNGRSIQLIEGETSENFEKVRKFLYDHAAVEENKEDYKKRFETKESYDLNIVNFMNLLIEYRKIEDGIFEEIVQNPPEFPYPELNVGKFNRDVFRVKWYEKEYKPLNESFIEKYYKDGVFFTDNDITLKCLSYIRIIQWILTYYTDGYKDISHEVFYPYFYAPMIEDVILTLKGLSEASNETKDSWLNVLKKDNELVITPVHQLLSVIPSNSIKLIPKEYLEVYNTYLSCINPKPGGFKTLTEGSDKSYHSVSLIPPIELNYVNNMMMSFRKDVPKRYDPVPDLIVVNKKYPHTDLNFRDEPNIKKKYFVDTKKPRPKYE